MNCSRSKLLLFSGATLFFCNVYAQNGLVFNKRFVECEDKWVAFEKGKDGSYTLGFIYIDEMAGLTLNYESSFTVDGNGRFIRKSAFDSSMGSVKMRLTPNNVKVAIIPNSIFAELKIKETPEWLHFYNSYEDTAKRFQRWGYYYNDFGMSEKALEYLEPGYKLNPEYKGMAVELAFAYNALEKFAKAIPVLQKMIELTPADGYVYKELSYAYLKIGNIEEAEKAALAGIKYYKDNVATLFSQGKHRFLHLLKCSLSLCYFLQLFFRYNNHNCFLCLKCK